MSPGKKFQDLLQEGIPSRQGEQVMLILRMRVFDRRRGRSAFALEAHELLVQKNKQIKFFPSKSK
jgi:hypothetical protein